MLYQDIYKFLSREGKGLSEKLANQGLNSLTIQDLSRAPKGNRVRHIKGYIQELVTRDPIETRYHFQALLNAMRSLSSFPEEVMAFNLQFLEATGSRKISPLSAENMELITNVSAKYDFLKL